MVVDGTSRDESRLYGGDGELGSSTTALLFNNSVNLLFKISFLPDGTSRDESRLYRGDGELGYYDSSIIE
ncbi:hypothetical protein AB9P05_17800 [Roseivirga sp. BDSF3-8]|uniref:hypothetical protein n=1 Tax=Roseivirga sp. BDSF3-8 TaxID=3241598 RepID=UPI00353271BD